MYVITRPRCPLFKTTQTKDPPLERYYERRGPAGLYIFYGFLFQSAFMKRHWIKGPVKR